ncbi:hypothetical protein M5K25_003895 [Dendrobium thyrsiflorum]|uniref:Uncharacterized protein n=1 Tax=Dendrobium thyrsiflorum TaxID=117978 RepID=A0ABD0VKE2_DENTH
MVEILWLGFSLRRQRLWRSAIVVGFGLIGGRESPPKFIRSICDVTLGSDSPSSGKYRSSSEL